MLVYLFYILCPLDMGYFGPLKKAYGQEIEGFMRACITHTAEFLPTFCVAFKAVMAEKIIQGAFRGIGLALFTQKVPYCG